MYEEICSRKNLILAWKKARKGKTKKRYVKRFEKNLGRNLLKLREELLNEEYVPCLMTQFILRDPKTRRISKSAFRDRIIHHALCNVISLLFEKSFIYDSHANQIGKGSLLAIKRFDKFKKKVSKNNTHRCFILKADIKHYFQEVSHEILLSILRKKVDDKRVMLLIEKIVKNPMYENGQGMPLGNLTSQFFANVYLNELDQFVKHKLKVKYYIRYVDDFVLFSDSKYQLKLWMEEISLFLGNRLKLELHKDKSKVLDLNEGVNFLGFRNFYDYRLLRKSNIENFQKRFNRSRLLFRLGLISSDKFIDFFEGWFAYAKHANTYKFNVEMLKRFSKVVDIGSHNKKNFNLDRKISFSSLEFSSQKTFFLFNKGFSIKDISRARGIKEGTVWKHISSLIKFGYLSLFDVISKGDVFRIVSGVGSVGDSLKDVKSRLRDDGLSYDKVSCVLSSL